MKTPCFFIGGDIFSVENMVTFLLWYEALTFFRLTPVPPRCTIPPSFPSAVMRTLSHVGFERFRQHVNRY
jgi:hypothetical protein